jgi:hypothetical protein
VAYIDYDGEHLVNLVGKTAEGFFFLNMELGISCCAKLVIFSTVRSSHQHRSHRFEYCKVGGMFGRCVAVQLQAGSAIVCAPCCIQGRLNESDR